MAQQRFKRVNVEISNICNLRCSFCPAVERDKQVMDACRFEAVIHQLAPLTEEVVLHLLGEPLGHPEFARILDACEAAGVPANVVTNGVLMTGNRPTQLLRPVVRQVSFSLHSFEDNFKDQDPAVYFARLQRFAERALVERPDLYVNFRLWDLDQGNADSGRNATMRRLLADAWGFDWEDVRVDVRRRKNWRIKGRLYLHFDSRFEWPRLDAPVRSEKKGFCHALTGHFGIHADGTAVPCCLDHKADMPLGNVFDSPVSEILASPRAIAIRDGFARGELVEDLCKRCTFISRFD